ncbi:hypothetical protein LTR78_009526 [Recurvomyces mirabilis]|uniref:F-box domain-containing protein n=1 Tax=Recurvomyces mirabilis TaxID=574656 RepID=A0AAE0TNE5_9PEZI|nr:hypothetical protein LTR78_009526 [Recurvomyces mirabilis]KAK5150019.1 hypothetical protein LTS14_010491 [Recurvomyces mirabilis]
MNLGLTVTQKKPRGLLDLPPEIWSSISRYAVTRSSPCNVDDMNIPTEARQPSITLVCRALRVEALPQFYAINERCHQDGGAETSGGKLHSWLHDLDALHSESILRRLTIHSRFHDAAEHYSIEFGIKLRHAPDTCNEHEDCILYCIDESLLSPKNR